MRAIDRLWCRCFLVDGHSGNLSITRVLSTWFAAIDGKLMLDSKGVITMNMLWLALICMACAFGKSTFSYLLDRFPKPSPPGV